MGIKCGIFGPTGMNYDHLAITQNVILDMGEVPKGRDKEGKRKGKEGGREKGR